MSEEKLTLTEAMKELRIIEKKLKDTDEIERYASILDNEKPAFESEDEQRREIKKIIQSKNDLVKRYLLLKKRIEYTNIMTEVGYNEKNSLIDRFLKPEIYKIYTISDLLSIKRKLAALMIKIYESLNTTAAENRKRSIDSNMVIRLYNEKEKMFGIRKWRTLSDEIEMRLETINATTKLLEIPEKTDSM